MLPFCICNSCVALPTVARVRCAHGRRPLRVYPFFEVRTRSFPRFPIVAASFSPSRAARVLDVRTALISFLKVHTPAFSLKLVLENCASHNFLYLRASDGVSFIRLFASLSCYRYASTYSCTALPTVARVRYAHGHRPLRFFPGFGSPPHGYPRSPIVAASPSPPRAVRVLDVRIALISFFGSPYPVFPLKLVLENCASHNFPVFYCTLLCQFY